MTISLYDISVASYIQSLNAVAGFLEKGKTYCQENNIDLADVVETQLYPDMLPFRFQVTAVAHQSRGAMEALETGKFGPPTGLPDFDYEGLQGHINEALEKLKTYTPDAVNAMIDNDVTFSIGETNLPFTAANFILSFSHPNVYFHAATAYDMLRMKGVPVGKRDFMGMPRLKM